jgi:hypothetical protein
MITILLFSVSALSLYVTRSPMLVPRSKRDFIGMNVRYISPPKIKWNKTLITKPSNSPKWSVRQRIWYRSSHLSPIRGFDNVFF